MRDIFFKLLVLSFVLLSHEISSQEKELFDLIITDENATPDLLHERMIITQRLFCGEKGLLRKTGIAP